MFKKWLTTILLIIISLLLATIVYLFYFSQNNNNTSKRTDTSVSVSSSSNNSSNQSSKDNQPLLSVNKITSIFFKRYPNTAITSIELEKNLLSTDYEINGVDDNTEYTLRIHAATGKIISHNTEQLDADERNGISKNNEAIDLDNIISLNNAVAKAKSSAGDGSLNGWSLEKDDNRTYWEIIIKIGTNNTAVKVDAQTGEVLEIDNDD